MKVNQLCVVAAAFMALSACGSPDGGLRGGIPPAPDPAPVDGIHFMNVPTKIVLQTFVLFFVHLLGYYDRRAVVRDKG